MEHLRIWIRGLGLRLGRWLGLGRLATQDHWEALDTAALARYAELLNRLENIEQKLSIAHLNQQQNPIFQTPNLDWDTVQAMALYQLENENKKEPN